MTFPLSERDAVRTLRNFLGEFRRFLERPGIRVLGGLAQDCSGFGGWHHDLQGARTLEMPHENVK